jgi:hypothetical protein
MSSAHSARSIERILAVELSSLRGLSLALLLTLLLLNLRGLLIIGNPAAG